MTLQTIAFESCRCSSQLAQSNPVRPFAKPRPFCKMAHSDYEFHSSGELTAENEAATLPDEIQALIKQFTEPRKSLIKIRRTMGCELCARSPCACGRIRRTIGCELCARLSCACGRAMARTRVRTRQNVGRTSALLNSRWAWYSQLWATRTPTTAL